ncbi:hypothetical protein KC331_g14298 [Hortaea werneckii]|uniref:Uncharacterized protein n=1 Tax=Hortaea werneckii TaxID=91943 RepID=A0A3M7ATW6_HORWE|nr:hypothetical protein KC331_g14298 [Hortaea werneckii]KAI7715573.1 hypothetical protein KC353_g5998 [Hortaea werneckii]RMY30858.1 hypothetical protein D0865_15144 [Hortaea werneckii]
MKINVAVKQRIYLLRNCTHVAGNKFKSLFNIKRDDPKLERQVDACHGQDCVNSSKLHGSSETSLLDHPLPPVEGGHIVDTSPLKSRSKLQEVETEASPSSLSGGPWIYNGEGAKCLTDGPTKLVLASDGRKPCMTIIPSTDLAIRLQETIKESRKVSDAEDTYLPKIAKLRDMCESFQEEIADIRSAIARFQNHSRHTDVDLRVDGLHQRATKLERKKEWAERKKDDHERLLKNKQTAQRSNVLYMLAYIEDAFVDSKLVDPLPPAAPVSRSKSEIAFSDTASYREAFGLDEKSQENSKALGEGSLQSKSSGIPIWEDPDYDLYEPAPTKATNDAEAVIWRYESAMTRLRVMQQDFDDREERFEQEAWDRMERQAAGEDVESDLAFDHGQIQKTRELANRLTEAEDLVEAAKIDAVAMGVQIPDSDIESGFVDDVDDGYRISSEAREAAGVDKHSIAKWMNEIPEEDFEGMIEADVDEWDCRSVAISESGSMVAEGSDRRRIDKWRSMCEAIKRDISI